MPAHSARIAGASEILAGCIAAAKAAARQPVSPQHLLQVPMHGDNLEVAQELLKLLYSKKQSQLLLLLEKKGKQVTEQVLRAADKYAMEELIDTFDSFFALQARKASINDVAWAAQLGGMIELPQWMQELESQLISHPSNFAFYANRLSIAMSMRIMQAILVKARAQFTSLGERQHWDVHSTSEWSAVSSSLYNCCSAAGLLAMMKEGPSQEGSQKGSGMSPKKT